MLKAPGPLFPLLATLPLRLTSPEVIGLQRMGERHEPALGCKEWRVEKINTNSFSILLMNLIAAQRLSFTSAVKWALCFKQTDGKTVHSQPLSCKQTLFSRLRK